MMRKMSRILGAPKTFSHVLETERITKPFMETDSVSSNCFCGQSLNFAFAVTCWLFCWLELVLVAVFVTKNSEYWLFFCLALIAYGFFYSVSSFWLIACSASTSVRILSLFYLVWIWGLIEVRICAWIMHNKISAVHMGVCCWLFLFLPWITGKVQSDRLKLVIGNRKIAT